MAATYNLISSQVLGSSAASVTFSSIPQTYTDLVLRISARSDFSGVVENMMFSFNSDYSGSYSDTALRGNGAAASSVRDTSALSIYWSAAGNISTSNTFGSAEIYIPSYTASQYKPLSGIGAGETNATTAYMGATAGLYRGSTSAISSILISVGNGSNWLTNSSFYLYGIKNS